jgi:hypothetical protein
MKIDYLDSGGYQPSTQTTAPDLAATTSAAADAVISGSQDSYEVVIENIDLNLYKDYSFVFSYILSNDDPQDTTIILGPQSPRFIVTQAQIYAAIPDYTESPSNVVATGGLLSYQLTWDKPTFNGYVDTIIWEGTSSSFNGTEPVVWIGTGTQATILTSSTANRYIKILHRDKFFHADNTSMGKYIIKGPITPVDPIVVDIAGPPAVGSASVTGGIDPTAYLGFNGYANITWGSVTTGDIRGYRIRFKPTTESVYSYADSPGPGTSYKLEGLAIGVTYEFAVATYDQYNNTTSGYVSGGTLAIPGTPVMTGYISAGAFKFGDGVVSGKRGLLFNSSNYWYINSGSTAEFKVGGPTSNYIKWDGTTLNIDGNIGATGTATIGGNINLSTSGASIYNGTINQNGTLAGNGFALNSTGLKVANGSNSVTLDAASGTITANAGSIAGWTLSGTTLSKNNISLDSAGQIRAGSSLATSVYIDGTTTWGVAGLPGTYYKLWSGNNNPANASFSVDSSGVLRATNAEISGNITANSIAFGAVYDGTSLSTIKSGAANGSTALQPNGTLTGNVSGTVNGVAASTLTGNAAKGATAIQAGNGVTVDPTTRIMTEIAASSGLKLKAGSTRPVWMDDTGLYMKNAANNDYSIFLDASSGSAVFRGNIYADNGYFKGDITGASGTFSGVLAATSGSFSGTITAGNSSVIGDWKVDSEGTLGTGLGLSGTYLFANAASGNGVSFGVYTNKSIFAWQGFSAASSTPLTFVNSAPQISSGGGVRINDAFVPSADNTYSLGYTNNRWQIVRSAGGVSTTSDVRTKKDIADSALGLNFIKDLRPVSYKFISGGKIYKDNAVKEIVDGVIIEPELIDRPGERTHWGFLAQNVKEAIDKSGVEDFAGWQLDDVNDPESAQSLVHTELLGPMAKAIQELSNMVESLQQEVNTLKGI